MQLILLAAGRGSRLGEFANDKPKSLVDIDGVAYLELQRRAFEAFPFSQKIVVCGFGADHLRSFFAARSGWTLVDNPEWERGNLYSLKAAWPFIRDDFYLFNADHYYSMRTYRRIFAHEADAITVFCDQDRNLIADDMKAKCAPSGAISDKTRLLAMSKALSDYDAGYVGVTRVPQSLLELYGHGVAAAETELGDKANVEHVIHTLAGDGADVRVADISGSWWTEIDTPEDLSRARETIRLARGRD